VNYLLDTCVISEAIKAKPDRRVVGWLADSVEERLFLSVLTLGELEKGIAMLPASKKRDRIRRWVDEELCGRFRGRVLDIDGDVALQWGRLQGEAASRGRTLPVIDGLLAATALVHNLTVVTRNVSDLAVAGVQMLDPWGQ